MTNSNTIAQRAYFKDQIKPLIVFGVIRITIGVVGILSIFLGTIATIVSPDDAISTPTKIAIVLIIVLAGYFLAGWYILTGMGSIKARRWARELIYLSSWVEIIRIALGLIFILISTPFALIMLGYATIPLLLLTILHTLIPVIFVLFYGSSAVRATCRFRDTQVRWNDKYPYLVAAAFLSFAVCIILLGSANVYLHYLTGLGRYARIVFR